MALWLVGKAEPRSSNEAFLSCSIFFMTVITSGFFVLPTRHVITPLIHLSSAGYLVTYKVSVVINDNAKHPCTYGFSHILDYFLRIHSKKGDYWVKGHEYFTGLWYTSPSCLPNGNNQCTMPSTTTHRCARHSLPLAPGTDLSMFHFVSLAGRALYVI